jgi:uncharacterized cupin superfamily protein
MAKINVRSAENPGRIDVSRAVGSEATAMYIYDLAPGQSSCPYHYEYEEEWLLVLNGDLVCFQAGPAGAHKIMNRSESNARVMIFSSARVPAVTVYPDSDKISVRPGDEAEELIFNRGTAVPWSHGEEGWDKA